MIAALDNKDGTLLIPQSVTNTQTVTANFDCAGFQYATVRVQFGTELNTNAGGPTISLLASDTTDATTFVTVVANRTLENLVVGKVVNYHMPLRKRYIRLAVTTDTTTNDTITVGASITLSQGPGHQSTTSMIAATQDAVVVVE